MKKSEENVLYTVLQTLVMKSHRKGGYLKAETKSARVPVQRSEQGLGGSGSRGGATASGCHHFCLRKHSASLIKLTQQTS